MIEQSRPSELLEKPKPGQSKVYVDASEVLIALALLGALAILVVALASWRISRRAVAPLGEALRVQRSFVADASHELRTPLTVLDARLQLLQRRLDRMEPLGDVLDAAQRDTSMMIEVVIDLLLVAEASVTGGLSEECDLRPAVLTAVASLKVLADDHAVGIHARVDNEARIAISTVSLQRALVVLIDNAIVHSPAGAAVEVVAGVTRGRAVLRVTDQGGGIEGIDRERIFERFARGSTTEGRRGFGIGLALVRDLATRHRGEVLVERSSAAGTTIRLELPLVQR